MTWRLWFVLGLLIGFCVAEWYFFVVDRGCGLLGPLNPSMHEYCMCDGRVYGPTPFNCVDCQLLCKEIRGDGR